MRRQEAQDFWKVLDSKYFLRCLQLGIGSFLRFIIADNLRLMVSGMLRKIEGG